MKNSGPTFKQGWAKALDWLDRQRFQVSGSLDAADLCDSFANNARRVPRNICTDPAVEAKRALCESLKNGLSAIKKSLINCLNEADEAYINEYGIALKLSAAEYLGLQLLFLASSDETQDQIQISLISADEPSRIQLRAKKQHGLKNAVCLEICVIPGKPGIIRAATAEDFERLISKIRS